MRTYKNMSKLELSGISFPPGSDRFISVSVEPISAAADMQRTVNGDLLNLSRAAFRKHRLSVSCEDQRPPGFAEIWPGHYVEAIAPDPHIFTLHSPATSATVPRASIDVLGNTPDGRVIEPDAQPADPRPLQTERDAARVSLLRSPHNVTFAEPVESVRYRPALACLVISTNSDADETKARASWSIELEEA